MRSKERLLSSSKVSRRKTHKATPRSLVGGSRGAPVTKTNKAKYVSGSPTICDRARKQLTKQGIAGTTTTKTTTTATTRRGTMSGNSEREPTNAPFAKTRRGGGNAAHRDCWTTTAGVGSRQTVVAKRKPRSGVVGRRAPASQHQTSLAAAAVVGTKLSVAKTTTSEIVHAEQHVVSNQRVFMSCFAVRCRRRRLFLDVKVYDLSTSEEYRLISCRGPRSLDGGRPREEVAPRDYFYNPVCHNGSCQKTTQKY